MVGTLSLTPAGAIDSHSAIVGDEAGLRSLRDAVERALADGVSEVTILGEAGLPIVLRVELAQESSL
jgi:hypothetical protein